MVQNMNDIIVQMEELIKNLKARAHAQSDDINLLADSGALLELIESVEIAKELMVVSNDQYNSLV